MRGKIVQVREHTDREEPNKHLVIHLLDDYGLHDTVRYCEGYVEIIALSSEDRP